MCSCSIQSVLCHHQWSWISKCDRIWRIFSSFIIPFLLNNNLSSCTDMSIFSWKENSGNTFPCVLVKRCNVWQLSRKSCFLLRLYVPYNTYLINSGNFQLDLHVIAKLNIQENKWCTFPDTWRMVNEVLFQLPSFPTWKYVEDFLNPFMLFFLFYCMQAN